MQAAKQSRESAAKDDDQIAFENATALEEACSYLKALEWYAEVNRWAGVSAFSKQLAVLPYLHLMTRAPGGSCKGRA